jgi:hypothetical protein
MGIIAVYPKITFAEQAVVQPLPALQKNVDLKGVWMRWSRNGEKEVRV